MKILFLCKGNVARSQAAAEFLKRSSNHDVRSSGTNPSKLEEWPTVGSCQNSQEIIDAMLEEGIDVSKNLRTTVSTDDVIWADKIYIMAKKEDVPEFVLSSSKVEFWDIEDPKGKNLQETRRIRDQVKTAVARISRI